MSAVARRYAKALFALAREGAALEPTADHLERLATLAEDPSVGPVLASPVLAPARRSAMVDMLAREIGLSDLLTRFVRLLADHQRLGELPSVRNEYRRMLDHALGRVRVLIRTAMALDAQQQADVITSFATLTGKQVVPQVVVDPDLLGGVVVEVGGKVYDGSVSTHLRRLAAQVAGTASL